MREMATLVLAISGDIKPLGKNCVNTFIRRNSQVASLMGKPIEPARIKGPSKQFANVDRIKQALEEAFKANVEAEAQKPRQIATKATTLGR
jgi:hypothetical protein